jgi:hypothetical protein
MEKFVIKIPCKPYTRRYLELTFGKPCDLSADRHLYDFLTGRLKNKSYRYDKSAYQSLKKYTDETDIKISRDVFYRHGWELSRTDTVDFNIRIEHQAKLFMYGKIGMSKVLGYSLTESVLHFQEKYGFFENIWPAESILRDCRRNLNIPKGDMEKYLKIMLENSDLVKKT